MDLRAIHWTPEIYYGVLAFVQFIVYLIIARISHTNLSAKVVITTIAGGLLLSFVGYLTTNLQMGALLIYLVLSFTIGMFVSEWNALVSFIGSVILIVLLGTAGTFLCYPHTDLYRSQIGGATQFIHNYRSYRLPFQKQIVSPPDKVIKEDLGAPPKP